ncbi:MAG: hypothetical protein ACO3MW_15645 [Rhodospirillales bacterium]
MKTKRYKIGQGLCHDVQITAEVVHVFAEREHDGKKYPAHRDVHTLADVRLSSGAYPFTDPSELLKSANDLFNAMREAYAHYPDGEVSVSMIVTDDIVNF